MREIKFRVWDKKTKNMIEAGSLFNLVIYSGDIDCGFHLDNEEGTIIEGDYELMQFTGLKDKNGREIYEGDLFQEPPGDFEPRQVLEAFWDEDLNGFAMRSTDEDHLYQTPLSERYEVIGNIWKNPGLLKEL